MSSNWTIEDVYDLEELGPVIVVVCLRTLARSCLLGPQSSSMELKLSGSRLGF
jgi:hypothetical protein